MQILQKHLMKKCLSLQVSNTKKKNFKLLKEIRFHALEVGPIHLQELQLNKQVSGNEIILQYILESILTLQNNFWYQRQRALKIFLM